MSTGLLHLGKNRLSNKRTQFVNVANILVQVTKSIVDVTNEIIDISKLLEMSDGRYLLIYVTLKITRKDNVDIFLKWPIPTDVIFVKMPLIYYVFSLIVICAESK